MKKDIYIDYASSTPTDPRILKKILPYYTKKFVNPSSSHFLGKSIKLEVEDARKKVAKFLNCSTDEIIFTSGGTESENLAIKGISFPAKKSGNHLIISNVEHTAVFSSADYLKKHGFEVTRISVDKKCNVNFEELKKAIKDETILVSVMYVNNEIGTVQPIVKIGAYIKQLNKTRAKQGKAIIRFHVDAEAACFYLDCDVKKLNVDSMSINGSKMYGIKGSGALFVKKGTPIATQITGGGQENYLRGGTTNVPAVVSLGYACFFAQKERAINNKKIIKLKKTLIDGIKKTIQNSQLNTPENSVSNIVHFTFLGNKKDIVKELSKKNIAVSTGSACAANTKHKSHTLEAMGFSDKDIDSSIRFSFGKYNTLDDVRNVIQPLSTILQ